MSINFGIKYNSIINEIYKKRKSYKTRNKIESKVKTLNRVNSNPYRINNKPDIKNNTNKSISQLTNRKFLVKSNSLLKNEFILNSDSKMNKIIKQYNDNDNDDTHNNKISDLLNNAKDFFNNLGNYLEENKPKNIHFLKSNKIYKSLSKEKRKDMLFPKAIKKKERNINKLYGRLYNIKILDDENKTAYLNKTNSFIINKNNSKISNFEEFETNNNNNFKIEKRQKNQIIQTFNIPKTNKKNKNNSSNNEENKFYKNNIDNRKTNTILPVLNFNNYNSNLGDYNKNNIKIAEIKEVHPCFPFNRLTKFDNNSRNNIKNNKLLNYIRNNFISDTRYYYEKFLKDIKLGNDEVDDDFLPHYRNKVKRKSDNNKIKKIYIYL